MGFPEVKKNPIYINASFPEDFYGFLVPKKPVQPHLGLVLPPSGDLTTTPGEGETWVSLRLKCCGKTIGLSILILYIYDSLNVQ